MTIECENREPTGTFRLIIDIARLYFEQNTEEYLNIGCAIMRVQSYNLTTTATNSTTNWNLYRTKLKYYNKVWNIKFYRIIGLYNDGEIRLRSVSRSLMEIRCRCYQWIQVSTTKVTRTDSPQCVTIFVCSHTFGNYSKAVCTIDCTLRLMNGCNN